MRTSYLTAPLTSSCCHRLGHDAPSLCSSILIYICVFAVYKCLEGWLFVSLISALFVSTLFMNIFEQFQSIFIWKKRIRELKPNKYTWYRWAHKAFQLCWAFDSCTLQVLSQESWTYWTRLAPKSWQLYLRYWWFSSVR